MHGWSSTAPALIDHYGNPPVHLAWGFQYFTTFYRSPYETRGKTPCIWGPIPPYLGNHLGRHLAYGVQHLPTLVTTWEDRHLACGVQYLPTFGTTWEDTLHVGSTTSLPLEPPGKTPCMWGPIPPSLLNHLGRHLACGVQYLPTLGTTWEDTLHVGSNTSLPLEPPGKTPCMWGPIPPSLWNHLGRYLACGVQYLPTLGTTWEDTLHVGSNTFLPWEPPGKTPCMWGPLPPCLWNHLGRHLACGVQYLPAFGTTWEDTLHVGSNTFLPWEPPGKTPCMWGPLPSCLWNHLGRHLACGVQYLPTLGTTWEDTLHVGSNTSLPMKPPRKTPCMWGPLPPCLWNHLGRHLACGVHYLPAFGTTWEDTLHAGSNISLPWEPPGKTPCMQGPIPPCLWNHLGRYLACGVQYLPALGTTWEDTLHVGSNTFLPLEPPGKIPCMQGPIPPCLWNHLGRHLACRVQYLPAFGTTWEDTLHVGSNTFLPLEPPGKTPCMWGPIPSYLGNHLGRHLACGVHYLPAFGTTWEDTLHMGSNTSQPLEPPGKTPCMRGPLPPSLWNHLGRHLACGVQYLPAFGTTWEDTLHAGSTTSQPLEPPRKTPCMRGPLPPCLWNHLGRHLACGVQYLPPLGTT